MANKQAGKAYAASLIICGCLIVAGIIMLIVGGVTGTTEAFQGTTCSLCGGYATSFTNNDNEISWQATFNASVNDLGYEQFADLLYDNTTFTSSRDATLFIEETPCGTIVQCYYPASFDSEYGFPTLLLTNPDPTGEKYRKFFGLVITGGVCTGVGIVVIIAICCCAECCRKR